MSREKRQLEHLQRLLDRTRSMSKLGFDDAWLTVNVSEINGALEEGGAEWDAEQPLTLDSPTEPPEEPSPDESGEGWGTCPECAAGKHGNCTEWALNSEDLVDLCACQVAKHRGN
jgi:hypothetical protein